MHTINITVRNKVAVNPAQDRYVCGNSDYIVRFDFDAEWDAFETKTARFIKEDGTYKDQVFSGNECPVPVISDTYKIMVGVFAGNLSTTTAAYVPAKKSILCGGGAPAGPDDDTYHQIMAKLNHLAPDPTDPHTELVTDKDGKAVWQPREFWREVKHVTLADNVRLENVNDDDGDGVNDNGYILTPWAYDFVIGNVYKVSFDGKAWDCTAMAVPEAPYADAIALGNMNGTGNLDAPFVLLCSNAGMEGGGYGWFLSYENYCPATITITGEAVDAKKIPEDLLPSKRITLTIAEDGTVTSDTAFSTAWAMTDAELQASITVVQQGTYFAKPAEFKSGADIVTRMDSEAGWQWIQIRFSELADFEDALGVSTSTRYIDWANGQAPKLSKVEIPALPDMSNYNLAQAAPYYMRHDGTRWTYCTVDQLKADLGLT